MLDVKFKLEGGHTNQRSWMARSSLRQLYWHVTYACNYRCQECFTDSGRPHPEELTTDEALQLVEAAGNAGVGDIILSGGEPFMRADLLTILERMGKLGITARIASNGSRLTDEMLGELRRRTLVKSLQISLDTLDTGLYGRLHGVPAGYRDAVLDGLSLIRRHGFHTTISTRLTPETLPEIPALLDKACAESWSTVTVHFPVHTGRTAAAFAQDTDFLSLLEPAFAHFARVPKRWVVETYIPWAPYHPWCAVSKERSASITGGAGRDATGCRLRRTGGYRRASAWTCRQPTWAMSGRTASYAHSRTRRSAR